MPYLAGAPHASAYLQMDRPLVPLYINPIYLYREKKVDEGTVTSFRVRDTAEPMLIREAGSHFFIIPSNATAPIHLDICITPLALNTALELADLAIAFTTQPKLTLTLESFGSITAIFPHIREEYRLRVQRQLRIAIDEILDLLRPDYNIWSANEAACMILIAAELGNGWVFSWLLEVLNRGETDKNYHMIVRVVWRYREELKMWRDKYVTLGGFGVTGGLEWDIPLDDATAQHMLEVVQEVHKIYEEDDTDKGTDSESEYQLSQEGEDMVLEDD